MTTNPTGLPLVSDKEFEQEQQDSDLAFDAEFGNDKPGTDTVVVTTGNDDQYIVTGTPEEIQQIEDHLSDKDSLDSLSNP